MFGVFSLFDALLLKLNFLRILPLNRTRLPAMTHPEAAAPRGEEQARGQVWHSQPRESPHRLPSGLCRTQGTCPGLSCPSRCLRCSPMPRDPAQGSDPVVRSGVSLDPAGVPIPACLRVVTCAMGQPVVPLCRSLPPGTVLQCSRSYRLGVRCAPERDGSDVGCDKTWLFVSTTSVSVLALCLCWSPELYCCHSSSLGRCDSAHAGGADPGCVFHRQMQMCMERDGDG